MVADSKKIMNLLKTARGQLDTVIKMAEEDRYCVDISTQLLAVEGLLNSANKQIITAHLKNCVNNAETEKDRNEKIDELVNLMGKIMK
ncbi:MAG: metal-sensing transcriptional repressor [Oscillospiraceae bacterium]|nr:metal-sensing transcriptional repressor [Oscillospiraceae bacterium]